MATPAPKTAPAKAAAKTSDAAPVAKRERHAAQPQPASYLIIRVRGSSHSRHTVEQALTQLHLNRRCHLTIANAKNAPRGVLQKIKDYAAFGPVDAKTIELLLTKRGETDNGQKLTDAVLAKGYSGFKTISELSNALASGKVYLAQVKGVQPCLRLNAPKGGFPGSIKVTAKAKGALGSYSAQAISKLATAMI